MPSPTPLDPDLQRVAAQAREDLARRLGVEPEKIELVELRAVVWPDTSLGCPQPGMVYTQVSQDGLLIRFRVDGRVYEYHGGGSRSPFLCEHPADVVPGQTPAPPPGFGSQ